MAKGFLSKALTTGLSDITSINTVTPSTIITINGVCTQFPNSSKLVVHYKFDETTGVIFTDETGNYDGTYTPNPGDDSHIITGVNGNAVDFISASNTYLYTGETLESTFQSPFSISFWLKLDDGRPSSPQYPFGFSTKRFGTNHSWVDCYIDTDGNVRVDYRCNSSNLTTISAVSTEYFSDGQTEWVYIVMVVDEEYYDETHSGRIMLYIDGVLMDTGTTYSGPLDMSTYGVYDYYSQGFILGGANYYGYSVPYGPIDGQIDDFRIYSYALNRAEIYGLYSSV